MQRARSRLEQVAPQADRVTEPDEPEVRALLDRYIAAFESSDAAALERLLRADATLEMTPSRTWFAGGEAIGQLGEACFEFAAEEKWHAEFAETLLRQRRVKAVGAKLRAGIEAAQRLDKLKSEARGGMHWHVERDEFRSAQGGFLQRLP